MAPRNGNRSPLNKLVLIFALVGGGGLIGSITTVFALGKTRGADEQRLLRLEHDFEKLNQSVITKDVLYPQLDTIKISLSRLEDKLDKVFVQSEKNSVK